MIATFNIVKPWMKDYLSVLTSANTSGYTKPDYDQRWKQNRVVRDLIDAGVWTKIDVFWMLANNGSKEFACINWKTPGTYTLTMVNSPTWTSNLGFKSNGTTSYLDTGWAPSNGVNYTRNDASLFCSVRDNVADTGVELGCEHASSRRSFIIGKYTDNNAYAAVNHVTGAGTITVANSSSVGIYLAQRTGATSIQFFKDNSSIGTSTTASGVLATVALTIIAYNQNGVVSSFTTKNISVAGCGSSLTVGQRASLYDIINQYQTDTP